MLLFKVNKMWGWGKKEAEPVETHSGYLDDCSEKQNEVLVTMRDWVKE
jgi:hypothetical protein